MARFNIAFDDKDPLLGDYFQASKIDISTFILTHNSFHQINEIPTYLCNPAYVDIYFPAINEKRFFFIAYSHGGNSLLSTNFGSYIDSQTNTHHFINSFFYAMACNSGKILGPDLISKGCLGYIGYDDEAYALNGKFQQLSIDCDNKGLKSFMSGGTLSEAFNDMKVNFENTIDVLLQNDEVLIASYLRRNLAALVLFGDQTLEFNSFN